jgi:molybdopterin synthase sulfur carrier subunit
VSVVRYFAAVKAAAGVGEEQVPAQTLAEALSVVRDRHDARFAQVLACCSYVVDEAPVGARDHGTVLLQPTSVVDCLPPFAGG